MRILFSALLAALAFAVTAPSALAQSYQVRPGDTLRVEVIDDPDLNRDVLVLPDGAISFPLVGTLPAAGRTINQINAALTEALEPQFADEPSVFVALIAPAEPAEIEETPEETISAYLLGEVEGPGLVEVIPGTTLLQLLSQSGGLTRFAATKRIQLRRVDPQTGREHVYPIDYRALERGASLSQPVRIAEGDVILVPERRLFE